MRIDSESLVRFASSPPPPFIEHTDDAGWPEYVRWKRTVNRSLVLNLVARMGTINIGLLTIFPCLFNVPTLADRFPPYSQVKVLI
jgi:hypothetical protein